MLGMGVEKFFFFFCGGWFLFKCVAGGGGNMICMCAVHVVEKLVTRYHGRFLIFFFGLLKYWVVYNIVRSMQASPAVNGRSKTRRDRWMGWEKHLGLLLDLDIDWGFGGWIRQALFSTGRILVDAPLPQRVYDF